MTPKKEPQEQKHRILFVGDFADLLKALGRFLTWRDKEFVITASIDNARASLSSESFDFAFLDLDSLGKHGFEIIHMMDEHTYFPTEFLCVANHPTLESTLLAANEKRVAAYESKPLVAQQLARLLENLSEQNRQSDGTDYEEKLCRSIMGYTKKGIWITDEEGKISFSNNRLGEMLRCPPEELISKSRSTYIIKEGQHPSDKFVCNSRVIADNQLFTQLRRLDGSTFWAFAESDKFETPEGMHYVDVFSDVGSQIRVDHMIIKQHGILENRAEHLRIVSDNLRITNDAISNQLRAPLWRISGICQYLLHSFSDDLDPEVTYCLRSLMRHSKDTTDSLEKLINDNQIKAKHQMKYKEA